MPSDNDAQYPDKDRLRNELRSRALSHDVSLDAFLNPANSLSVRLNALRAAGNVESLAAATALFALAQDRNEIPDLRAAALQRLVNVVASNEGAIEAVLRILADPNEPGFLRDAALTVLQTCDIASRTFSARRGEYTQALRALMSDRDDNLRRRAMSYLALKGDEVIQAALIAGLETPRVALVEPELAIQLLSYDLHANSFPILRRIAESPPNLRSKKEALRNLAADPESAALLERVMLDPAEDPEVRHVSAVSLQALDPKSANAIAKNVILDSREDVGLRTALLNTLAHSSAFKADEDRDFVAQLATMQSEGASEDMRKVYRRFIGTNDNRR